MDGQTLLYQLRQLLNEGSTSSFLDDRTSYDFLYEAARKFVNRTNCLRATQTITTVANQSAYNLSADFSKLYLRDLSKRQIVKFNDGSTTFFPTWCSYEEIVYRNNVDAVAVPNFFSIIDAPTLSALVTGTASVAGAASGGQCTLTDTSSSTKFANVEAGDNVHNTTDGSDGIVLSKTDSTHLVVALFGGSGNDWTQADAYVIQPQGRLQIVLDPPPSVSGYTVTVYYIALPAPVYSSYGVYRFPKQHIDLLLKYAEFLYKYRDREPAFGDKFFSLYERELRAANASLENSLTKSDFSVSFKARK